MVFWKKIDEFVGMCGRGYSGVFWDIFCHGKCTRGREERVKSAEMGNKSDMGRFGRMRWG